MTLESHVILDQEDRICKKTSFPGGVNSTNSNIGVIDKLIKQKYDNITFSLTYGDSIIPFIRYFTVYISYMIISPP